MSPRQKGVEIEETVEEMREENGHKWSFFYIIYRVLFGYETVV